MRPLAVLATLAALFLSSCASYQLGTPSELPYSSVEVVPPRNLTTLPQIEGALNSALRKALSESSSLELATSSPSDATLEITLAEARRQIAAVPADDVGRGRKFEITVEVLLSLRRSGSPDDYLIRNRSFTVTRDVFTDSGQVNAEHQATVEIASDIAARASEILEDRW